MNSTEMDPQDGKSTCCAKSLRYLTPAKIIRIVGWIATGLGIASFFALIFGFLVKWLWGMTLSPLFNLPQISYWQAVGLIVLSRLLFGGFGHHKPAHNPPFHQKFHDCFQNHNLGRQERGPGMS